MSKLEEVKSVDELTKEDWPLLKELENTRFSLKNKKKSQKQTLSSIKEQSDQEDLGISSKSAEDDKLVDAFLESRAQEELAFSTPKTKKPPRTTRVRAKTEPIVANEVIVESPNKNEFIESPQVPVNQPIVELNNLTHGHKQITINTETPKLIAMGLVKTYLNRTDNILNPLRFIMANFSQVMLALLQFLFPALIVTLLVQSVPAIQSQLDKESPVVYGLYILIFYFACMFLFVSAQVIVAGLYNMLKFAAGNLEKAGKTE